MDVAASGSVAQAAGFLPVDVGMDDHDGIPDLADNAPLNPDSGNDGDGSGIDSSNGIADRSEALDLAGTLDRYNNGDLCTD